MLTKHYNGLYRDATEDHGIRKADDFKVMAMQMYPEYAIYHIFNSRKKFSGIPHLCLFTMIFFNRYLCISLLQQK